MRRSVRLTLSDEERELLERWSKGRREENRRVERAKIVLMASRGIETLTIAEELKMSRQKVARWRNRFEKLRIAGIIQDAPRGGRRTLLTKEMTEEIIRVTTTEKPKGATHWSTRTLAKHLGITPYFVSKVWKSQNLKPWLVKTFKISNDPDFAKKVIDVVGLYLNPPEHAIVLSVDEKTQIQALDRAQKSLPIYPGRLGTMTHDYKRNGTTTLFAAIDVLDGRVHARCEQKHTHKEWLLFLKQLDRHTDKDLDLHIILDNYATHKEPHVKAWLAKHKRIHLHFIPTSSSWLNIIERWFRDLTVKQIRRGAFKSIKDLEAKIWEYIHEHNADPQAFHWTAKADQILEKVQRAKNVLDML